MGKNIMSDGNCGLYALINVINDNKNKNIVNLTTIPTKLTRIYGTP